MTREALIERETTDHVIGAFFEVYNGLGFGFLERIYADALEFELLARSRKIQREVATPIWYKGKQLSSQRVDMIVDDRVLLEIKSTHVLPPTAERQLLNYLRASSLPVGLLLHFGPQPRFHRRVHSGKGTIIDPRNSR
jgi:GxxExxY protein